LLGGVHCFGMCGSIVGILTAQLPKDGARWPFHLAYANVSPAIPWQIYWSALSDRLACYCSMWCRYCICCLLYPV
jgi:hypothetical protein